MRKISDPAPKLSAEELKKIEKFSDQLTKLRNVHLEVLDNWNALDSVLVDPLSTIVGTPDPIIASAVYFTPHTFRTRLDISGKIVWHIVTSGVKDPSLIDEWKKLSEKLGRKRQVRNWASHGHIISYIEPNGKNHALLAPVQMQMDNYLDASSDGRKPGATLQEVNDAINTACGLCNEVKSYHSKIKKCSPLNHRNNHLYRLHDKHRGAR